MYLARTLLYVVKIASNVVRVRLQLLSESQKCCQATLFKGIGYVMQSMYVFRRAGVGCKKQNIHHGKMGKNVTSDTNNMYWLCDLKNRIALLCESLEITPVKTTGILLCIIDGIVRGTMHILASVLFAFFMIRIRREER